MDARRLHIDIETCCSTDRQTYERVTKAAREKRPNGNASKIDKEQWDTPEAADARALAAIRKTAVDPLHAEILCIVATTGGTEGIRVFPCMDEDEAGSVSDFARWCDEVAGPSTIWSAYNGKRFDFAVLANRMTRHRVRPPDYFPVWDGRGWRGRVFDTMERLPTYDPFTSFTEACEAYGLECKTTMWKGEPMNGSRVQEAWEAEEFDLILDYCAADVLHEEQLYLAMTHGDTWGTFDVGKDTLSDLSELAQSELSPAQKWLAFVPLARSAGWI